MSFEEEFDKIVRQKAEEAHYPFDQANWEKASSMLDAGRKAAAVPARSTYLLPISILVGIAGAGIVAAIYFTDSVVVPKEIAQTGQEVGALSTPSANQITSSKSIEAEQKKSETSALESQLVDSDLSSSGPSTEQNNGKSNKVLLAQKEAESTNSNKLEVQDQKNKIAKIEPQTHFQEPDDNKLKVESEPSQTTASKAPELEEQPISKDETKPDLSNQVPVNTQATMPDQLGSPYSNGLPVTGTGADLAIESKNAPPQPFLITQEEVEFIPYRSSSLLNLEESEKVDPAILLKWYEPDYYKPLRKYPVSFIGVQAGVSYLNGWKNNNTSDGRGFNWQAGIHAGRYFSKHVGLGLGLEMFSIQHINQPFYKSTTVQYSFGSITNYTMVTSNALLYLAVPLKAYLRFNKSNQLAIGVSGAWLMQASNTEQTYRSSDLNTPVGPAITSKGVYQGVNRLNWSLLAEYQLNLSKRLIASAAVSYGLSDIFVNNAFANTSEKALAIRLGLQYNFIQK